jgi:hypothetical protein
MVIKSIDAAMAYSMCPEIPAIIIGLLKLKKEDGFRKHNYHRQKNA